MRPCVGKPQIGSSKTEFLDESSELYKQLKKNDEEYYRTRDEYRSLSETLRQEYSLYGLPPFENAPIEEFVDYLMDGEVNPRSEELKSDSRYQSYISLGKKLDELRKNRAKLLRQK